MTIAVKNLGMQDYLDTYNRMCEFNKLRTAATIDQIWLLEHHAVYTLGLAGKTMHLLKTNSIPVIKTDRGGQITYHGPGQLIAYLLIDIRRRPYGVSKMITLTEQAIIDYLKKDCDIIAERKISMPGVYVQNKKIAALGMRISKGSSYHGLAINIDMDLSPFNDINPCGYPDLTCTQLADLVQHVSMHEAKINVSRHLLKQLDLPS